MASKTVGTIRINLSAGTVDFLTDMDKSNAKLRDFGRAADSANAKLSQFGQQASVAGAHGVTGVQAVSGALRVLEGGLNNNLRAAERFTANILGLGPVLQKAFPLIGGIAFAGLLVKLGEEVYKFFKDMRNAPEIIGAAFRDLNAPLRLTNNELQVTNDRLEQDIAKLEGKRQNTLKTALDEAIASADKLAESLNKDLESLNKLLIEHNVGFMQKLMGMAGNTDIQRLMGGESGSGGVGLRVAQLTEEGNEKIRAARAVAIARPGGPTQEDIVGVDALRTEAATKASEELGRALDEVNKKLKERQELDKENQGHVVGDVITKITPNPVTMPTPFGGTMPVPVPSVTSRVVANEKGNIEELLRLRMNLQEAQRHIPLSLEETGLTRQKEKLEKDKANEKLDKPVEDKIKALTAQLQEVTLKMQAAGLDEAAKVQAAAKAAAIKDIEEINKLLERQGAPGHHPTVSPQDQAKIKTYELSIKTIEAEGEWRKQIAATTATIKDQIRSQEMLTAAIGKGYEAVKAARVETAVMKEVKPEHYNDPDFMKRNEAKVAEIRTATATSEEAKHIHEMGEAIDKLGDQITLETRLAQVQSQGAQAVRLATLQVKLAKMEEDGATEKLLKTTMDAFYATERLHSSEQIAKIDEQIAAIHRLAAAQLFGAEAVRKANLENRITAIRREGDQGIAPALPGVGTMGGMSSITKVGPKEVGTRTEEEAQHQEQINAKVSARVNLFKNELDLLNQEKNLLLLEMVVYGKTADTARALRDIEDARLKIAVQQALAQGTAMAGVKAFFLEMQQQAKTAASIMYDALNSSLDKLSDNLTKAMTGQKTEWSKMFKGIGEEMLKNTVKSGLQQGIGAIGAKFGITGKKDGNSEPNALWVRLAGALGIGGKQGASVGSIAKQGADILKGNNGILGTGQVPKISTGKDAGTPRSSGIPGLDKVLGKIGISGNADGSSASKALWVRWVTVGVPTGQTGTAKVPNVDTGKSSGVLKIGGPDGTPANPFYVVTEGGSQGKQPELSGVLKTLGAIVGLGGLLGWLGGGGGKGESVTSSISFPPMASGGDTSPGQTYMTGEQGPELFRSNVAGHIANATETRQMMTAGDTHVYTIDARGTDPVLTGQRVAAAIQAAHNSSVGLSIRAAHDQARRVPAGAHA